MCVFFSSVDCRRPPLFLTPLWRIFSSPARPLPACFVQCLCHFFFASPPLSVKACSIITSSSLWQHGVAVSSVVQTRGWDRGFCFHSVGMFIEEENGFRLLVLLNFRYDLNNPPMKPSFSRVQKGNSYISFVTIHTSQNQHFRCMAQKNSSTKKNSPAQNHPHIHDTLCFPAARAKTAPSIRFKVVESRHHQLFLKFVHSFIHCVITRTTISKPKKNSRRKPSLDPRIQPSQSKNWISPRFSLFPSSVLPRGTGCRVER